VRRPIVILTLLAFIWGASFMLIKIADRQLTPATLILGSLRLRGKVRVPACATFHNGETIAAIPLD
jgi:hypothetical protein